MKYKVYLFDFDYTLANSEVGIVKCFELLLAQENYPIRPKEEIKRTIGMPMVEALAVLTGEQDRRLLQELKDKYTVFADLYMTDNTVLFPETIPMLKRLHEARVKVGIISSKTRRRIMQTLTRDDICKFVDFVKGSEDVKTFKPSPEGILSAIEYFGVAKEEVLYIGDNVIDAKAAQNAQVDFAGVLTGTDCKENFKSLPHIKIMQNLSEL